MPGWNDRKGEIKETLKYRIQMSHRIWSFNLTFSANINGANKFVSGKGGPSP